MSAVLLDKAFSSKVCRCITIKCSLWQTGFGWFSDRFCYSHGIFGSSGCSTMLAAFWQWQERQKYVSLLLPYLWISHGLCLQGGTSVHVGKERVRALNRHSGRPDKMWAAHIFTSQDISLQGPAKLLFPGSVNHGEKIAFPPPDAGKKISPWFTETGTILLLIPVQCYEGWF